MKHWIKQVYTHVFLGYDINKLVIDPEDRIWRSRVFVNDCYLQEFIDKLK